jgi:hypothetical protein
LFSYVVKGKVVIACICDTQVVAAVVAAAPQPRVWDRLGSLA